MPHLNLNIRDYGSQASEVYGPRPTPIYSPYFETHRILFSIQRFLKRNHAQRSYQVSQKSHPIIYNPLANEVRSTQQPTPCYSELCLVYTCARVHDLLKKAVRADLTSRLLF